MFDRVGLRDSVRVTYVESERIARCQLALCRRPSTCCHSACARGVHGVVGRSRLVTCSRMRQLSRVSGLEKLRELFSFSVLLVSFKAHLLCAF